SGKITYGPYENTKPYTKKPITIHCENNSPFLVATKVDRVIEISHWGGNLAVEENVEIVNKGAFLRGSFSRLDFQMDRRGMKQPVVRSFKSILPPATRDIYYRDEIGNISTSSVYPRNDRVEVELRPRFPLFGGWRTNYVLGYNIPSSSFLHSSGSNYALRMKMMDRLFDNAVVQKLRLKIILPEMSTNIKLVTPYSVKRLPDETYKTYLDTFGRTVVVIEKENLINNHIQTFTLYYEFERIYLIREPLMVICAFLLLFLISIILFRLDFSIESA
uniref:Dolichyl-diphosphooligosaccharide--protein glycosyltransferase subunit 1 n=1 Tax=Meloidogyne javanica TaxID=6303 RepID=A0A915N166_MELJA